ncbi:Uncharacterized protein APZ42_022206 [Daphnia magna]|uniref:Uncharacterized protein n=1 Tax=Daphnia magna TaxID=35525 RepID=A0A164W4F3_9CRUS|nr:Uncharacterized protein APZ42_022206 [Daphnia magna]
MYVIVTNGNVIVFLRSENGKCHQLSDRFHLRLVNLHGPAVTLKTGTRPCQWLKESDPDPSSWLLACLFRGSFVSIKDFGKEDLLLADIATILVRINLLFIHFKNTSTHASYTRWTSNILLMDNRLNFCGYCHGKLRQQCSAEFVSILPVSRKKVETVVELEKIDVKPVLKMSSTE